MEQTTCCVVGGGPAGMMLGLLLARAGVKVTVLEKHGDFLRDFRGDTVHASTLTLLDELGLGKAFAEIPHRLVETVQIPVGLNTAAIADMHKLPGKHKHIAMVPQWDFLELLANAARKKPTFTLRMRTEATDLIRTGNRVTGVRYRTEEGELGELNADLVVACDGRESVLRTASVLPIKRWPSPMDAWWFRLPRNEGEMQGLGGRIGKGRAMAIIDRGDYFQIAYLIAKGSDASRRAKGLAAFHADIVDLVPWMADRVNTITSWDQVKLLNVKLNRLTRWYRDGLLCIGDAAHAMSPVGGVGINLAIQDAVAAARILALPLHLGTVDQKTLRRVQLRRWLPTVVTQGLQKLIQDKGISSALEGKVELNEHAPTPLPLKLLSRFPALRGIPAYIVAIGVLPEHAPRFARN